jgi:PRTRC genetic system ThiF family protein
MIDFSYANSLKLMFPMFDAVHITLIGCGGTGSWLAPHLASLAMLLRDRGKNVRLTFCDPDNVEKKNIYRQNFAQYEIGTNKAVTLASRYSLGWGVDISANPKKFDSYYTQHIDRVQILIGCVDGPEGRQEIAKALTLHDMYRKAGMIWWLDSGNFKNSGQILLGCNGKRFVEESLAIPGFCSRLPSPAYQHPELLTKEDEQEVVDDTLSCADMALKSAQGLSINARMAAELADYLVRMLITSDLRKFQTYIDLESGTTRSTYITRDNLLPFFERTKNDS